MAYAKSRTVVASVAAFSLIAALTLSVFSQAHAATALVENSPASEPCPEHMPVPLETVSDDGCESLCASADLDHFLGLTTDRQDTDTPAVVLVDYDVASTPSVRATADANTVSARGPPGKALYLTTRRLRL